MPKKDEWEDNDYVKFNYYIDGVLDRLRDDDGWSDDKIAWWLRDKARSIETPRIRKKKIKLTVEEIAELMKGIQEVDKILKAAKKKETGVE